LSSRCSTAAFIRFHSSRHYAIPLSEDHGLRFGRDCRFVTAMMRRAIAARA
jgi:hypothetical protein